VFCSGKVRCGAAGIIVARREWVSRGRMGCGSHGEDELIEERYDRATKGQSR
jgi:hypothetical protein